MKILLAEDSPAMMMMTSEIIEKSGHQVIRACNGEEALNLYFSETPDLILLDIEMPKLDGFQVTEKIRSIDKADNKWVPIIFLTSLSSDEYLSRAIDAGGDDYLVKPINPNVLNAKLHAMQRIYNMQNKLISVSNNLKQENQKNKDISNVLIQKAKQQQLIAELSFLALSESSISKLMNMIVIEISKIIEVDICAISKLTKDQKELTLVSAIGLEDKLTDYAPIANNADTLEGHTLLLKDGLIVKDVHNDKRFPSSGYYHNKNIISSICVTINKRKEPWGVLSLYSTKQHKFSTEEFAFIQVIANYLSEAVQRKTTEENLKSSKQHFSLIMDHIKEMLWLCTADGMNMLYVSPAYETITGYTVDEFYKDPNIWLNSIHPEDRDLVIKSFANSGIKGKTFTTTFRIIRKDGEERTVCDTGFPIFDEDGNLSQIAGTVVDITEQKKSEERLARLKILYEHILYAAGEGIYGLDKNGNIMFINPAATNMLGFESYELIGKSHHDLIHHTKADGSIYKVEDCPIYKAIYDAKIHQTHDEVFWRKDKTSFPVEFVSTPILDINNSIVGAVVVFRDISIRKQMAAELHMAQKLESVGQLAAGIAHEINTPAQYVGDNIHFLNEGFQDIITVLNKYSELRNANVNESTYTNNVNQIEEIIEKIDLNYLLEEMPLALTQSQEGIQNISNIVKAMKEFSHPGSDGKDLVDLNHIIENTVTVTRNEWKYVAKVELDLDENLPAVPCYAQNLGQVFMNLIVNAAHAIADVIDIDKNELGTISISTIKIDDEIEIKIRDTGKGIPEKIKNKIFDPFFTTKGVGKGTGQGLAIARSAITDKHNGAINCISETGKGSTFFIRLPLEDPNTEVKEDAA